MAQLISIQERSGPDADGNWQAVVRFNNGPENPITISNPFSEKDEEELEWYYEEHLEFPFTRKVRAQHAALSVKTYGEKLFQQVFGDPDIYTEYRGLLKAGPSEVSIAIEGEPAFHALHWEALKDPKFERPLAVQATMVRKNKKAQKLPLSIRSSPTINLLIVTARPSGKRDVGYRTISRPLVEGLRNANLRVQVDILRPGTYRALENHLRETTARHGEGYYHVIHFDVHGAVLTYEQFQHLSLEPDSTPYRFQRYARDEAIQPYEGVKAFLSFEPDQDDDDKAKLVDLVESSELAALLVTHQVPITILNSCQSGKQIGARETSLGSRLIQEGVQLVLAMGYSVTVSAAELLMRTLYQKLFDNDDLKVAIRHARTELYNNKARRAYFDQRIDLEDWLLPVVYQNQAVQLKPRDFTPEERSAYNKRKLAEKQYTPPEPQYGFVGRDLDILQIEKRLLSKRNLLLIRGMGGAGKTTLLKHLRAWWHTTGFVQQTYYFGYDERAWTLQQILTEIAQQLYGNKYYTDIQPYPLDEQQLMIAEKLRAEPHLLILDNLESITGAHLAIQHTLPKADYELLESKKSQERRTGQLLIGLEYENLVTALNLALTAQVSIKNLYLALFHYLDSIQDLRRGLDLSRIARECLEQYPDDKLSGPLGIELVSVIDRLASRELELKQFKEAEESYKKALFIYLQNETNDADTIRKNSATFYHQLGRVAEEQRHFEQAEQYYQKALQIKIEFNDRYSQASTYHQLGIIAQKQMQWLQAEQYFQQALQIKIEFNSRYSQARTYIGLGVVAQEQRQRQQAEQYYQQALQIFVEYNDRHGQAGTYHQLGRVAEEQLQWEQAREYFIQALEIYGEYSGSDNGGIVMRSLARLWNASGDAGVPARVARMFGVTVEEVEKVLREALGEEEGKKRKSGKKK